MASADESKYLQNIFSITQTHAFKQLIFMVGVALSVAAGFYAYSAIQDPVYRPLDYKMSEKNAAVIADTLDKAHIQYKINDVTGVVMVSAKDAQVAKYKLAAAGIQKDDNLNFSYLNDQNSIGESQFIENARYLRALEGDLVKTITAIDGVSAAKVHIAMPNNNVFADESGKPTASIFITVGNGLIIDKEKVRSIVQIVASSVPGLDPKNVAITDQYGHYLSNTLSDEAIQTAEQMNYQNNIQSYYEKRIESLINPLIGENKVSVRVHANIDFSQQEEAKEQFDPDQKVIRSEETTSEETGSSTAGGPAGALANTPPTAGDAGGKGQSNSSQGRSQSIKNYELGKSVTYKKSNVAKISGISVAVVVDNDTSIDPKTKKEVSKPIDKERLAKITDLVKATIGYDEKRGDVVTVVNSTFNVIKMDAPVADAKFWTEAWFWEIIKKIVSIGFALVMFLIIYKKTSSYFAAMKDQAAKSGSGSGADESGLTPEMRKLKNEQINQLKEIASKDPNRVALVIKNWVSEKTHG
jgi:flagellar M-ring protein FliF